MTKKIIKISIRIVLVSLYALLVMRLVTLAMPISSNFQSTGFKTAFMFLYLFLFNLNVEGNLFFDRYLNRKLSWFDFPKKRLVIQLLFIFIWTFITIGLPFMVWYFANDKTAIYAIKPIVIFISSVVFLVIFIGVTVAINFFKQWQISLLETEHYKQEKLKSDYRVLQNQVNPHFLFNSLNVLISEIKHNPNTAVEFTRKLSKVYRYVLQSKHHDLISLKKELEFIDSFIYLHKVRIGEALSYSKAISEAVLPLQLPPLTLHILVENAIKHNIANEENVLEIVITSIDDSKLVVQNNLQPKQQWESTYTGLSNLSKRYELLKKDGFSYKEQEGIFVVTIPLIKA